MGKNNKKEVAEKTAIAYFGLSSAIDKFPKDTKINIHESFDSDPKTTGFLGELAKKIESVWHENIGTYSRTARLSTHDFLYYINNLREERGASPLTLKSALIETWMKNITDLYDDVVLVEIVNGNKRKLLLVNTKITL
ncbi:MAG: hypothetical protein KJ655_01135 [Candidatus Thermoplasmatota archaeon]|nr:hypothetical protein [Candidatus Thermoplasmatota archaeon]